MVSIVNNNNKMSTVQHFVNGLKSRNRDEQNKAAAEFILYVKTELRELPPEELSQFLDDFNHHIFDMVSSSDASEKKGGVLAISKKKLPKTNRTLFSFKSLTFHTEYFLL